ncbi:MAG: translation initiation factor IF-2 [Candidatus Pacebacteria bacterium]|nr:translation initiation factor IF-2 [Candidatus Paceibacterota bacterium]
MSKTNRSPIVVVLGHVDHGKSSILEAIKDLKITQKESGGITQHIGAYEVEHQGKKISFIDTPGHEAFSAMRSRGAKVADVAILVVAADDGVKMQTKEAIKHAQKAQTPIIVAINKIDKPEANVERITQQLAEEEIYLESIGGKTPSVQVSAKTKQNLNDLLEMILLVSEMENLESDPTALAEGVVIESQMDPLKGPTATIIVKDGTLKRGDIVATYSILGKIRSLEDFQGKAIKEAGPSTPAVVYGFSGVPFVGEEFCVFEDSESAKQFIDDSVSKRKQIEKKEVKDGQDSLNIIVKSDFLGSLEAIEGMLSEINQDRVVLNVLKLEVGDVNESDVKLAKSSNALIFAFRVKVASNVRNIIERDEVPVFTFDIIYELLEKVKESMEESIVLRTERVDLGQGKVLAVFFNGKGYQILGCNIFTGEVKKKSKIELFRGDEIIGKGKVTEIKLGNKNVERVAKGEDCGISYEGSVRAEEGDVLVFFIEEKESIDGLVAK